MMPAIQIFQGDALSRLREMPDDSIQCCISSPPYWGLRNYGGKEGQIGLEATYPEYVQHILEVFTEVRRVLKPDGTLWLNLGDTSATGGGKVGVCPGGGKQGAQWRAGFNGTNGQNEPAVNGRGQPRKGYKGDRTGAQGKHTYSAAAQGVGPMQQPNRMPQPGLKNKDLVGIPWRVAFALQAAGWYLRSDIIWHKPNPMPESVTDRPTRSHEHVFLLSKSEHYFYNSEAIKEPASEQKSAPDDNGSTLTGAPHGRHSLGEALPEKDRRPDKQRGHGRRHVGFNDRWDKMERDEQTSGMRNKRDVWTVAPANYEDAHFATYPPLLIQPMILAGSRPGDTILDPFGGSGTTGQVALELGRNAVLIELNADYCDLIRQRTSVTPGLAI